MSQEPHEPCPAELIAQDGRALHYIAAAAGVSVETVWKAKQTNRWPTQHRTRSGLRRALGLDQPAEAIPSPTADLVGNEVPLG